MRIGLLKEFKEFALRGNVIDLAVGIIIGGAFGQVVSSLVKDVIMPPLGLLVSEMDFSQLKLTLKAATDTGPAVAVGYGQFLNVIFSFLIVALAVFLLVKGVNTLRRRLEAQAAQRAPGPADVPPALTPDQRLLTEIRDLLRKGPEESVSSAPSPEGCGS